MCWGLYFLGCADSLWIDLVACADVFVAILRGLQIHSDWGLAAVVCTLCAAELIVMI